jgi:SAM-dependent methyltransferase
MTTTSSATSLTSRRLVEDGIGWDVATWSRAWAWCQERSRLPSAGRALEVGADGDDGGLSLLLAARGWSTTCTGLQEPSARKRDLHRRHGVEHRVEHLRLDVLDPPALPPFDLVVVKSTLGHVGQDQRFDLQRRAVRNLHRLLRPGGELWVLENAAATPLHAVARRRMGAGRTGWRYLTAQELDVLLAPFASRERTAFGVAAAGGRSEHQRQLLGQVDAQLLEPLTPRRWRYVLAAVATA